jgi:formylglycine-generating enzyme required for sulfatase activity
LAGGQLLAAPVLKFEPKPGDEVTVEIADGVKMVFCWIPPGEVKLGSQKEERAEVLKLIDKNDQTELKKRLESEAETVRGTFKNRGFWLGKFPVTQREYESLIGINPSHFNPEEAIIQKDGIRDTSHFPVDSVSWFDCQRFIKKLNSRDGALNAFGKRGKFVLPHEDQWEYACRGDLGNKRAFYWGDELNGNLANCAGTFPYGTEKKGPYLVRTSKVGAYASTAPHPWGLCDMSGNIYQWCENWYDAEHQHRVQRGGSWLNSSHYCRSAYRYYYLPEYRYHHFGFRICFVLDEPTLVPAEPTRTHDDNLSNEIDSSKGMSLKKDANNLLQNIICVAISAVMLLCGGLPLLGGGLRKRRPEVEVPRRFPA